MPFFHRVALVFPPTGRYCREDRCQSYFAFDLVPSMRPPLEEVEAAGAVREAGATPWLLDAPALGLDEEESLRRVLDFRPDVLTVTITYGSLLDDLAFLAKLRERLPGVPLGLRGGPTYTHAHELLEHPQVDFLVRGDPEPSYAALVREGLGAPGVSSTRAGVITERAAVQGDDLDALPKPDRTVLDPSLYRVRGTTFPQATIHVQRGCPFPCTYCLVATVTGRKARHRSPDDVAAEMKALRAQGTRFFYLRAETLTLDRSWARELARAITLEAPGARWVSATRVDVVDGPTLDALGKAGCYGLSFGVETGSVDIGKRVKKVPDLEVARAAFRACDEAGIASLMYVMLGFYWDTPQTLQETAAFVRAVRPDLLTFFWAHPYPGTPYHAELEALGVRHSPAFAQARTSLEPPGISSAEIRRLANVMTLKHYTRPRVLASLARKLPAQLMPTKDELVQTLRGALNV